MWKVEYTDISGNKVVHADDFYTRKSARLWCKKVKKKNMVIIGPGGEREEFQDASYI